MKLPLGTPHYMAPELIQEREYDERVDTWSIGVMTYEMLYGTTPFHRPGMVSNQKLRLAICTAKLKFPDEPETSEEVKDFIKLCLNRN
jgi:serine/threonine protein kinase